MKNSVDAAAFYKAMTALLDIPTKSSIRALREIKVAFDANQCVLSATDLNTWMSVTLPASGDSFDFVFRNSANIQKICRHYDGALELELQQREDEFFLTMRSGSKGGEFPVYDTKDCPAWPKLEVKQTYTSFTLSDLRVAESVRIDDEPLVVKVNVKNTGMMAGSEVVQLYVHDGACCYDRPEKELKAFCKVHLQPGEEKTVTLTLGKEDFAGWYADFGEWIVQPGQFDLLIGTSAEDIRLTASVHVRCRDPFGLSGRTAIGALVKDRQALEIVNRIMEDDIETLAAVALAYAPDKTLHELWNATNIHGALLRKGWDEEEIARRYAAIMGEFEKLQAQRI